MDLSLKSRMAELLDIDQVEELRSIPGEGDLDLFSDVAQLFLRTTPELLEKLELAVKSQDLPAVAKQAHMLKGSSSNLGAFRLSEKSHRLEQAALQGVPNLEELLREILVEFVQLRDLLAELPPQA